MHHKELITIAIIATGLLATSEYMNAQSHSGTSQTPPGRTPATPLVTFVELGSVKCIPCRQMVPVMKAIEEKYGNQVNVVFYDVWKDDQAQYADKYRIRLIPTQVFLDKNGKEFFRHEGFYPEAEIDKLLQKRGLKILKGK